MSRVANRGYQVQPSHPSPDAAVRWGNRCASRCYQNTGNLPTLALVPAKSRVLDCGCGMGDNARQLRARGCAVTGLTISPAEREAALAYSEDVHLADLDQGLPQTIQGPYDVVLMSHVLEHLLNPEQLLEDCRGILTPGGLLIVALPNVLAYATRLSFLLGRFEYTSGGVLDETHLRFYTFRTGRLMLERCGYRVVLAKGDGAFPLWRVRSLLPLALATCVNRLATQVCPGLFAAQCLYVARLDGER